MHDIASPPCQGPPHGCRVLRHQRSVAKAPMTAAAQQAPKARACKATREGN
jgi:hypothetical protein